MQHKLKTPTYTNRPEPSRPAENPAFPGQHEGEEVSLVFRQHPVVMRKGLIFGLLVVLLGTLPSIFDPKLSVYFIGLAMGLVFGILVFLPWWVRWYFSVNILTNERIFQIKQQGFFKREIDSLFHARIHAVNYNISGFQGHLLGYGTIHLLTEVGNFDLPDVHHPAKLHEQIVEAVRDHIGEDE